MTCFPGTNIEFSKVPPCRFCTNVCPILPFRWHSPLPRAVCPLEVFYELTHLPLMFVPVPFVISLESSMFDRIFDYSRWSWHIHCQFLETLNVSSYSVPFRRTLGTLDAHEIWRPGHMSFRTLPWQLFRFPWFVEYIVLAVIDFFGVSCFSKTWRAKYLSSWWNYGEISFFLNN